MRRLAVVTDLWRLLSARKKLWLLPLVTVLLILGAILVFAETSAIAPFIYSLF
jgi:hypothetical protein